MEGPRYKKQELLGEEGEVRARIKLGWREDEIVIERVNMPLLNDCYIHPEKYKKGANQIN